MLQRGTEGRGRDLQVVPSSKWVRARLGGTFVGDTKDAKAVIYDFHPIAYAFPVGDLRQDLIVEERRPEDHPRFGRIRQASLRVDGRTAERAVRFFESGAAVEAGLEGYAALNWGRMDAWYEEDEEVYVHPKDPMHRLDVLHSTRHVVVELDGERIAESRRPTMLFEASLPVRFYLPQTEVELGRLRSSETRSWCPYKGHAEYFHVEAGEALHEDVAWIYRVPFLDALKVQGLVCFYNERVDLTVDGQRWEKPGTPWKQGKRTPLGSGASRGGPAGSAKAGPKR